MAVGEPPGGVEWCGRATGTRHVLSGCALASEARGRGRGADAGRRSDADRQRDDVTRAANSEEMTIGGAGIRLRGGHVAALHRDTTFRRRRDPTERARLNWNQRDIRGRRGRSRRRGGASQASTASQASMRPEPSGSNPNPILPARCAPTRFISWKRAIGNGTMNSRRFTEHRRIR